MTGSEAKKLREAYGFTLQELADIFGYSQRGNILRVEEMTIVPKLYRFALLSLTHNCNSVGIFLQNYFQEQENKGKMTKQDYQIVFCKARVLEVRIKEELSAYLIKNLPFPKKRMFFNKPISLLCIQFEYKI
ncbi:hypothetical protein ACE193_15330 [Bernardetia sp. OM2101]|uniref:hypothetical protein n=1 Tax=Bernardetia sp. OM2101 TaxID=3344876 RepID=UPI0035D11004